MAESIRRDDPIHCEVSRARVEGTEELGKGVRGRGYLWVTTVLYCIVFATLGDHEKWMSGGVGSGGRRKVWRKWKRG